MPNRTGRPLAQMTTNELAIHVANRAPSPGQLYARELARPGKDRARARVLSLLDRRGWGDGLTILTLPGLHWTFERALLRRREGASYGGLYLPRRTFIESIEQDEAIYREALRDIPGHTIQFRESHPAATCSVRTNLVMRFHRARFEDYVRYPLPPLRAAWLDFTGCLTPDTTRAVRRLWRDRLTGLLVVTAQNGRIPRRGNTYMHDLGEELGVEPWDVYTYHDTSPMIQGTFLK